MVRLETVIVVVAATADTLPSAVKVIVGEEELSVTPLGALMVNAKPAIGPTTGLGRLVSHAEPEPAAEA